MMVTNYTKDNETLTNHFDKIADWLNVAEGAQCQYFRNRANDFNGYCTGEELVYRFKNNTAPVKVKDRVREALAVTAHTHVIRQPTIELYHDEYGITCDVTAFTMGEEHCMINLDIQEVEKRAVWIACSFGATSGVDDKQFCNRGIALIRAVKYLQAMDISVGIVGYSACTTNQSTQDDKDISRHVQTIIAKQPQNELNEAELINMFTAAATLRTIGFSIREHYMQSEHGSTCSITKADLKGTQFEHEELIILNADPQMDNFKDEEQGAQYVQKQINKAIAA
jgi:hypothetical protein